MTNSIFQSLETAADLKSWNTHDLRSLYMVFFAVAEVSMHVSNCPRLEGRGVLFTPNYVENPAGEVFAEFDDELNKFLQIIVEAMKAQPLDSESIETVLINGFDPDSPQDTLALLARYIGDRKKAA